MAFSRIQGALEGPATGVTVTGAAAGNFLVVEISQEPTGNPGLSPIAGMQINSGVGTQLTWTKVVEAHGYFTIFNRTYQHTWFVSNVIPPALAGTIQVRSWDGVGSSPGSRMRVTEIACADTQVHVDTTGYGTAAATANPSISLTTTEDNGMVFSAITASHGDPAAGAGYTSLHPTWTQITSFEKGSYDLDHGLAGVIAVPWTVVSSTYLITAFSLQEGPPPVPFAGKAQYIVLER
jgi:hypothetical protein